MHGLPRRPAVAVVFWDAVEDFVQGRGFAAPVGHALPFHLRQQRLVAVVALPSASSVIVQGYAFAALVGRV